MIEIVAVAAPGKAFLLGEYAVLDGAAAVVTAVDRYAVARLDPHGRAASPFVTEAVVAATRRLLAAGAPLPAGAPTVDSRALHAGPRKLGLGSSAAVTVAAHGAVLAAAGLDPRADLAATFRACDEAHGRAQGSAGSGADIAAAVYGGTFRFQRRQGPPSVRPLAWPAAVAVTFVDSGAAASTGDRVARWRAAELARPDEHRALAARLGELSGALLEALGAPEVLPRLVELVGVWNRTLDDLAALIDLPIRTPAHRHLDELARAVGGVAKPSGAGGGDLAVCFTSPEARAPLAARLHAEGLEPLALTVAAPGLHCLPEGSRS